jgi:hypothetical protein
MHLSVEGAEGLADCCSQAGVAEEAPKSRVLQAGAIAIDGRFPGNWIRRFMQYTLAFDD